MRELVEILGIKIDRVNMQEAVEKVEILLKKDAGPAEKPAYIVTPNSEMIVMSVDDKELTSILNSAYLSTPDGAGVVLAAKIMGTPLIERVAGFDLLSRLIEEFAEKEYSFYFLGSRPGVVDKAVVKLKRDYPQLNIAGYHHGYLDRELQEKVISEINKKNVDLLLVGMGVPLQERFIGKNIENLNVGAAMTVGGSFDVIAGEVNRAPLWMQKVGLEWFYRLLQEPSRFGRMLALPRFILLVLRERFLGRRT
ncbi:MULTISPECIES: WecB/TagA/CpsF family glycosyltransferase [unclassified Halanaerobium]|uniref:WecB/TagA/CpsF family glycosyltransferase n=1 Tax=unclassified Halanaerobium TaxID=2641197 RepID=UPI000DF35249|nr:MULTISPECIES: WecB/TagA/CpsF family glycosyltransferase [unclassified Halanaerobium]RCW43809.1 N-acetylmannosaminyltransferase [Halanaerobium sp. MA284_MarDTE_T2]RCW80510.1 N-acetylmannosaminyltransferase [Halanaerobium sp. DL-01]